MKTIRQRYILFEIFAEDSFAPDEKLVLNELWKKLNQLFGLYLSFQAGLWMIRWDSQHRIGILRCDNVSKDQVMASMAMIKHFGTVSVVCHTRKTSGTVKKTLAFWRESFQTPPPPRTLNP